MSPYIVGYNKKVYKYDLYAICNHGGNVMGGHYTASIKKPDNKWYLFNDTNITQMDKIEKNEKPYCFFYRKKKLLNNIIRMDILPGQVLPGFYDSMNRRFAIDNPLVLIILTVLIVLYYIIFNYLGAAGTEVPSTPVPASGGIKFIEIMMWGLFIFLILVNGLQYFFSLDIKASIKNLFSSCPRD